jgi:hypothetical protein
MFICRPSSQGVAPSNQDRATHKLTCSFSFFPASFLNQTHFASSLCFALSLRQIVQVLPAFRFQIWEP